MSKKIRVTHTYDITLPEGIEPVLGDNDQFQGYVVNHPGYEDRRILPEELAALTEIQTVAATYTNL